MFTNRNRATINAVSIMLACLFFCQQLCWAYFPSLSSLRPIATYKAKVSSLADSLSDSKNNKSPFLFVSRKEGFIESKAGKASEELKNIREKEREKLTPLDIPNFNKIADYIQKKINSFEEKVKNPKTDWEKKYLPEYLRDAKEGFERLKRLYGEKKIFRFSALVYGKNDYALGYGSEDEIGIAEGLVEIKMELLSELLLCAALYIKTQDGWKARQIQEYLFEESYIKTKDKDTISMLGDFLSKFIDKNSRTVRGVDLLKVIKEALKGKEVTVVFTDDTDWEYEGKPAYRWENELRDMFRADNKFLFFGSFGSILNIALVYDSKEENIKSKKHFKVLLNKEQGLVGGIDIPEELNIAIKRIMEDFTESVLIDIIPFLCVAKSWAYDKALAENILKNLIHNKEALFSFEEFIKLIERYKRHYKKVQKLRRQMDRQEDESGDYYLAKDKLEQECCNIFRIFRQLPAKLLREYLRRYLLRIKPDDRTAVHCVLETFGQINQLEEWFNDMLWDTYLDETNTSNENNTLLQILVYLLNELNYDYKQEKTLPKIAQILKEKELNKTTKAMDILLRLKIDRDSSDSLFNLLSCAHYKKELLAAFCLVQTTLFGVKEEYLKGGLFGHEFPGMVSPALSPESRNIYYELLKIEDLRRRGGALKSEADNKIFRYTIGLDEWADVPGLRGYTWFSSLRECIHRNPSSSDLIVVRTVLYFWKELNKDIIKGSHHGLITHVREDIGDERAQRFSSIINNLLKTLKENRSISSLEGDGFLDELLNILEEEVIERLKEINPDAGKKDLEKIEYMLRLYYALSERYGVVYTKIIPNIKYPDLTEEMLDFMEEDYSHLLSIIDTENHPEILSAISKCRQRIRHHLLFEKTDIMKEEFHLLKERLMELDYNMFMLGKEKIVRVLEEINRCRNLEDLRGHIGSLASMGRFMQASGLGGVEFEQFVNELENKSLKYSQVHDLTRTLRTEVHKITRKLNENIRYAMAHIWDSYEYYDLTDEWQKNVKTEKRKNRYGHTIEVISKDERERVENSIVDTLIQDTGIASFDDCLLKFNEILETKLRPDNDMSLSADEPKEGIKLNEQFFRFGQTVVIPRQELLSLWSKKGLNLVKMTQENIDVPPGVILSAKLMTRPKIFKSKRFQEKVKEEIGLIRRYSKYPDLKLLLYARSGSAFALPGLLITIPNIGMNDKEAEELAELTGDAWFAYDTYAEFMRAYAIHILGIPEEYFQEVVNIYKKDELSPQEMKTVCERYKQVIALHGKGQKIPETMIEQVMLAVDAVYDCWDSKDAKEYRARHRISQEWGTVVILQKGVFGNLNPTEDGRISGAGAGALRILPDGREVVQGKFRFRSLGHQIMSGAYQNYIFLSNSEKRHKQEQTLEELQPEIYKNLLDYAHRLKNIFGNNQHFEFTVELNKIWVTQTNDDIVKDDYPEFIDSLDYKPIARGHGVSGGALRGWVCNSFQSIEALLERYKKEKPKDVDGVILFLDRVNPELINRIPKGVHIVARIISVHAETLAQRYGITAVYGIPDMEFNQQEGAWYIAGRKMLDRETISIDGHENQLLYHNSGNIYLGSVPVGIKADQRVEVERRTSRALERIRELTDSQQWEEAMARRREALVPFEREVLSAFEKFTKGKAAAGDIIRYLMNYRAILDKIALHCEDLNFELYGDGFKEVLKKKLAEWDIGLELFMKLTRYYHPRSTENNQILEKVISRLSYKPPVVKTPREISVYTREGREVKLTEEAVFNGEWPWGGYFILHLPKRNIKLVSFEMDDVLEQLMRYSNSVGVVLELFRALKSMGLRVAITSSNPGVADWFNIVRQEYPEIGEHVDYCHYDFYGPKLKRYVEELGLKPDEIMHFGNVMGYGFDFRESIASDLHEKGFVSVLVGKPQFFYKAVVVRENEIMERKIDVLLPEIRGVEDIIDIVKHWRNIPSQEPETKPAERPDQAQKTNVAVSSSA